MRNSYISSLTDMKHSSLYTPANSYIKHLIAVGYALPSQVINEDIIAFSFFGDEFYLAC